MSLARELSMELDFDKWDGNRNKGESLRVGNNEIDKVLNHLKMLDQNIHTQLVLAAERSHLSVGGGKGLYVCSLALGDHEEYYSLLNKSEQTNEEEIDVVTGGQSGLYP